MSDKKRRGPQNPMVYGVYDSAGELVCKGTISEISAKMDIPSENIWHAANGYIKKLKRKYTVRLEVWDDV